MRLVSSIEVGKEQRSAPLQHATRESMLPSPDGIDPHLVPKRTLYTGASMPAIGLGTFGSDHVSGEMVADAVQGAISVGYRHLDCASVYGNEDRIGIALGQLFAAGVPREELWIVSKLWN